MDFQPPTLEFAFEAKITLSRIYEIGETAYGKRRMIPITEVHLLAQPLEASFYPAEPIIS